MPRGLFIVIEGVDGAGSTTQSLLLTNFLRESGYLVINTKEPSNGMIGQLIREHLRSGVPHSSIDALLFAADRLEHLETIIKPALKREEHVICDRYLESSLAYQTAEGNPTAWLEAINRFAIKPDQVIILDIDPATSLNRKHYTQRERFETVEFLKQVRENFKKRAKSHHYQIVNADNTVIQVHEDLKKIVLPKIEADK